MVQYWLGCDVLTAARQRISEIWDFFGGAVAMVSGGKDGDVLLHLCAQEAIRRGEKIRAVHIDYELTSQSHIDHIIRLQDTIGIEFNYYAIESLLDAGFDGSNIKIWDSDCPELWLHQPLQPLKKMPGDTVPTTKDVKKFLNYSEKFPLLLGIRADESYDRYRSIMWSKPYAGKCYGKDKPPRFYPLYDWADNDIWLYHKEFNLDYNKFYDYIAQSGLPRQKMRTASLIPRHNPEVLALLQKFEPDTWEKMLKRNFPFVQMAGERGCDEKAFLAKSIPAGFTGWREYEKFLRCKFPAIASCIKDSTSETAARLNCKKILCGDVKNVIRDQRVSKKRRRTGEWLKTM